MKASPAMSRAIQSVGAGSLPRPIACALFVAALLAAAAPGGTASRTAPARYDASEYDGFAFLSGSCEQGEQFCEITTPRAWAPVELDLVRASLDEISASDLGRQIARRAGRNGFRTVRRFAQAAQLNGQGRYEAEPMIVATAHSDESHAVRSIDITDHFFERGSARDHFSGEPGYRLTTEILVHELVHAMDLGQQYSGTAEFRRAARLGMPATQQREADQVNLERERLDQEGRYESSWQASRYFAVVRMRGRLPSVQALDSYREAFAEFGAHLVLDPNARRRFEPRLLRYFDGTVFGAN